MPLWLHHHGNARPFGEVARGVLGSKLSLYPGQCGLVKDITLTHHKSVIKVDCLISAGNCDGDLYSHNHLERFCSLFKIAA